MVQPRLEQTRVLTKELRKIMTKKQSVPEQLAVGYGKSVYTRKEESTGACSESLAAVGKKNENLQVPGKGKLHGNSPVQGNTFSLTQSIGRQMRNLSLLSKLGKNTRDQNEHPA